MTSLRRRKSRPAANRKPFADTDPMFWMDLAIRFVLGVFFGVAAWVYFTNALAQLLHAGPSQSIAMKAVSVLSMFAMAAFVLLIACLYAVRLRPVSKFAGWKATAAALLGAFLMWGLLFLEPRADLPVGFKLTSSALILIGNIYAIIALRHLGRSFSILPEGRALVTTGPYRFMRHPLYFAEFFATLGAAMVFWSWPAFLLFTAQVTMQFARMHYEEKVLRETFSGYAAYSRRTARVIPGIY
ncbi:MAG: isoprenylcysteine carboxylmethyltransferase family protein [Bdellovibrionales bacterium]